MAWTTTPWTLPSNLAIAVHPEFDYVKIKDLKENKVLILAKCRLEANFPGGGYEVLGEMKGKELAGIEYVPLFDYFEEERRKDGCFKVLLGDFVTTDTGTGIVHIAPGYGEEDYKISVANKIIAADNPLDPLDDNGFFTESVPDFQG